MEAYQKHLLEFTVKKYSKLSYKNVNEKFNTIRNLNDAVPIYKVDYEWLDNEQNAFVEDLRKRISRLDKIKERVKVKGLVSGKDLIGEINRMLEDNAVIEIKEPYQEKEVV